MPPQRTRSARTIDLRKLREIDEAKLYSPSEVGRFFGRSPDAVCRLIQAGRLASHPDPIDRRRKWVRGSDVLALAGGLLLLAAPAPAETAAQRSRRAAAAATDAERIAREKMKEAKEAER